MLHQDARTEVPLSILAGPPPVVPTAPPIASPCLALDWKKRRENFAESVRALLQGPPAPRKFLGDPYFRDCWVSGRGPREAFLIALCGHAIFVLLLLAPLWNLMMTVPAPAAHQREQITWFGPVNDLPLILPPSAPVKHHTAAKHPEPQLAKSPVTASQIPAPQPGADAFHPRQTIVNAPMRPNHPRQTLIQPAAPPEPPKILPSLPNIVAWNASVPRLRIDPAELARLQPKIRTTRVAEEVPTPEVPDEPLSQERQLSAIRMEAVDASIQKPALPVGALPAPRAKSVQVAEQSAPNMNAGDAGDAGGLQLIALSAAPSPTVPPTVPAGNLSSSVTISPDGTVRGAPSSGAGPARTGAGPPGLSITGGSADKSSVSGLGGTSERSRIATPAVETPPSAKASEGAAGKSSPAIVSENSLAQRMRPGAVPEALLGDKRIYTLHVNMPNLTSAAGSWILSFAELAPPEPQVSTYTNPASLAAPEPLRKVDPKYPPELRGEHVEGEVVLYAVIRTDGTVDGIQLVRGIDPALDANAMQALAQWKFRPAERQGEPVALEAIVRIPFRAAAPAF
jgi:protein TonB